jgi:SP family general alpha glucoside:H+ symporter-like MFS transporter
MSNSISEKPAIESETEAQHTTGKVDSVYDAVEKVDYNRAGAIDAENAEHKMGVLEAVKAYPAASWWAFVMSATIVSSFLPTISTGSF